MSGSEWGSPPHMRGKAARPEPPRLAYRITPAYAGKRHRSPQEKSAARTKVLTCSGSPLRMRGKGSRGCTAGRRSGITPAYAGKSTGCRCRPPWRRDHPRACGEKFVYTADALGGCGITPAFAGKSCRWCHHRRTAWDHPRVCGEKWSPRPCTGRQYRTRKSPRA